MSDEKRTINLLRTLINSGDVIENFEEIIEECKRNNTKYTDLEFYPQKPILKEDKDILRNHEWRRIEDQYSKKLFENISPDSVLQGKLADCYLIVSFIYASHDKKFVECLFHPKSSLEYGCVLIYFYFLGERIPVIVDTQIPYRDLYSTEPLFSHPRSNTDSCWFVLVEKAFAKACGGYYYIETGQIHFGIRTLFDQFPKAFAKIEDIIPESTLKSKKIDIYNEIFKELVKLKRKNAMIGTSVSMLSLPDFTPKKLQKSTGLIPEHAYQILDIRESEKKRFLKIRNPWGKFEWKGAYSNNSKYWTNQLKKELNYSKSRDGSFWMQYEDFLTYFKSIYYSLPDEKDWKKYNVYGKIEGYLDGRSPCSGSRNVGCIPQWSIKFTKKTVVRLSYDVSGPPSFHGLYICKNHGRKVDSLDNNIEIMRTTTNSTVNGIEYTITDFSEPFTFFLNRIDIEDEPCYYRILIESPDKNFSIKKFNDDFLREKWNSASYQGMFTSPKEDQWDPFGSLPLTTCRQFYLRFPEMKDDDQTEVRIQFFKNKTTGPLFLILAKKAQKIDYALKSMKYFHFTVNGISDYEEFSIPIDAKKDENSHEQEEEEEEEEETHNNRQWSICVYRMEEEDVSQFKFVVWCKEKFEFGLLPEPDPFKNCGYTVSGKLFPGKEDGASPYEESCLEMRQWCLVFKKSPTIIFVDFSQKNSSSIHSVYLERRNRAGDKIDRFFEGTVHFDFDIQWNCCHDRATWNIVDVSRPYALCVTRESAETESEFVVDIFGDNEFEMYEIEGDKIGNLASKFKPKKSEVPPIKQIEFKEVKLIEQPENFKPMKTVRKSQNHSNLSENQKIKQNLQEGATNLDLAETILQTEEIDIGLEIKSKNVPVSRCCFLI